MPACKRLIGPYLLRDATLKEDCFEATDLRVLYARDMCIGCRVRGRQRDYSRQFFFEFTIRSERVSGVPVEYDKVRAGWCDWLFYAHAHKDAGGALTPWWLIDLHAWRYYVTHYSMAIDTYNERTNGDSKSRFRFYDLRYLHALEKKRGGPAILIASSHPAI